MKGNRVFSLAIAFCLLTQGFSEPDPIIGSLGGIFGAGGAGGGGGGNLLGGLLGGGEGGGLLGGILGNILSPDGLLSIVNNLDMLFDLLNTTKDLLTGLGLAEYLICQDFDCYGFAGCLGAGSALNLNISLCKIDPVEEETTDDGVVGRDGGEDGAVEGR